MLTTSSKLPFDFIGDSSPQSKGASFHKLENKILLTQVEDTSNDCEDDYLSSSATIRESLNTTIMMNNSS